MLNRRIFKRNVALATLTLLVSLSSAQAADTYLTGTITNLTSLPSGVMLMMDQGVPTNCASTSYGWMLVRQEHKAMLALLLMNYAAGKKRGTIYTNGIGSSGYCEIGQFDPED